MQKLANISQFEALQNQAHAGFVSDMAVFNGRYRDAFWDIFHSHRTDNYTPSEFIDAIVKAACSEALLTGAVEMNPEDIVKEFNEDFGYAVYGVFECLHSNFLQRNARQRFLDWVMKEKGKNSSVLESMKEKGKNSSVLEYSSTVSATSPYGQTVTVTDPHLL